MNSRIVVDASPLIVLCKAGLHETLPALFNEVFVPFSVKAEIYAGSLPDAAIGVVSTAGWINSAGPANSLIDNPEIDPNLGRGELDVLGLALELQDCCVLLGDAAARKTAKRLNLSLIGTGGLLLLAKRNGLIVSVAEALEKISGSGLWISPAIREILIRKAGEQV